MSLLKIGDEDHVITRYGVDVHYFRKYSDAEKQMEMLALKYPGAEYRIVSRTLKEIRRYEPLRLLKELSRVGLAQERCGKYESDCFDWQDQFCTLEKFDGRSMITSNHDGSEDIIVSACPKTNAERFQWGDGTAVVVHGLQWDYGIRSCDLLKPAVVKAFDKIKAIAPVASDPKFVWAAVLQE